MDFERAVAAFQRKRKGRDLHDAKREAYRAMLKEYEQMKYANVGGKRVERQITQEKIDRREKEKQEEKVILADTEELLKFVDIKLETE